MTQITLEMLKNMKPDTIFVSGEMTYEGKNKWLAVRGFIYDWAIYYGEITDSLEHIRNWGIKLHDMTKISELVNCEKEVLEMYRH